MMDKSTMSTTVWYCILLYIIGGMSRLRVAAKNQHRRPIPGPKSYNDRIAIIGAGLSGIHMAYRLKALGFHNVDILEKENRIGGKVFDVCHRGTTHQMTFITFFDDFIELGNVVRNFTNGKIITPPVPFADVVGLARKLRPRETAGLSDRQIQGKLLENSQRYIALHRHLFGQYVPFIFPRPSKRILRLLRGSFADFLRRNNLAFFEVTAQFFLSIFGYGQPNRMSAVYGVLLLSGDLIQEIITQKRIPADLLDIGLLSVLQSLKDKFQINVKFNIDIKSIKRCSRSKGGIRIQYTSKHNPHRRRLGIYDFLIVSAPVKFLMNVIDVSNMERQIFGRQILDTYFSATLCDSQYGIRLPTPTVFFLQNVVKYDYEPYAYNDIYASLNNITGERYRQGIDAGGNDGKRIQTTNYLSLGRKDPNIPGVQTEIDRKLNKFLTSIRRTPCKTIARYQIPYFLRFSIPDSERGRIWDVLDLQGNRNTWYIGLAASIEGAGVVIQYNDRILRSYLPPPRW